MKLVYVNVLTVTCGKRARGKFDFNGMKTKDDFFIPNALLYNDVKLINN